MFSSCAAYNAFRVPIIPGKESESKFAKIRKYLREIAAKIENILSVNIGTYRVVL